MSYRVDLHTGNEVVSASYYYYLNGQRNGPTTFGGTDTIYSDAGRPVSVTQVIAANASSAVYIKAVYKGTAQEVFYGPRTFSGTVNITITRPTDIYIYREGYGPPPEEQDPLGTYLLLCGDNLSKVKYFAGADIFTIPPNSPIFYDDYTGNGIQVYTFFDSQGNYPQYPNCICTTATNMETGAQTKWYGTEAITNINIIGPVNATLEIIVDYYPPVYVTLKKNDGTDDNYGEPTDCTGQKIYTLPSTSPSNAGNIFVGWSIHSYATNAEYHAGDTISVGMTDIVLYAVWTLPPTVYVALKMNDGTNDRYGNLLEYTPNGYRSLPTDYPSRTKYRFLGWSTSASATTATYVAGDSIYIGTTDIILYAIWELSTVYVTLRINDGTNNSYGTPIEYTPNGYRSLPTDYPSRTKYRFLGWSTSASATTATYVAGDSIYIGTTDIILYAIWELSTVYVTLKMNDGTTNNYGTPAECVPHGSYTLPATSPSRLGYVFLGWSTNPDATSAGYLAEERIPVGTTDIILYAVWKLPTAGVCGANLTWTLSDAGLLTINGTGLMYNYSNSSPSPWYLSRENISSVLINYGATSIGHYAFSNCSSLTSITIPNSVTMIRAYAFRSCSGSISITIPNSVTTIEGYAFQNCSGLTSITISNSVTTIEGYTFCNCSSLTSITIPNSVTTIEGYAFYGCSSLTSITIPNDVTTIRSFTFYNCSSLTSITIPNSVTTIGVYAFSNCSSLTSITIPNSVTTIEGFAFQGCSGLTSITISNSVTTIERYAFNNCSSLTSITIPNSVTTIGVYAFRSCSGLTSITFNHSSSSPLVIGNNAFYVSLSTPTIIYNFDSNPAIASYNWAGDNRVVAYRGITNFHWTGVASTDGSAFVSGASVPTTLRASYWNSMYEKIKELKTALGQNFTYTAVAAGSVLTAAEFNTMRTAISGLPNAGALPPVAVTGQPVYASYFVGSGSLKNALNAAIAAYNAT